VRKTFRKHARETRFNPHFGIVPKIPMDGVAFPVEKETVLNFQVSIAISNRNFTRVPTDERVRI
jgi:hypothetical protein